MNVIEKNQEYTVTIVDIATDGAGIGKINQMSVFIPNTVTNDVARIKIVKVKKTFAYGKLLEIITPSDYRTTPKCSVANQCGGCQLQHITYDYQLEWKRNKVQAALQRIGAIKDVTVKPTLGMQEPWQYRNKAQYPIRQEDGKVTIGFFAKRSHRIVAFENCHIQDPQNAKILEVVTAFIEKHNITLYDEQKHKGLLRHLLIKTGYFTKEIMVCVVINGKSMPHQEDLIAMLQETNLNIKSIVLSHNTQKTNVILGYDTTVIYKETHICDTIKDLKFKISPLAFYQVNPLQTQVLYQKVLDYAELKGNEIVWDAYCGIGTISLFLAKEAKHVYGVEIIDEAIIQAKENAKINQIDNITFYTGKAEEVLPDHYQKTNIHADLIVIDPPRKGCEESMLQTIIEMAPPKVIYVSCDPATLARDLKYLTANGYQIIEVQPVDMFPHTTHIETVCLMCASSEAGKC